MLLAPARSKAKHPVNFGPVGAVGNVISIPIRATISGKQLRRTTVLGGVMISLMNSLADVHFKREPGGRLVFIPFPPRESVTSWIRRLTKKRSEPLSTCTGFLIR